MTYLGKNGKQYVAIMAGGGGGYFGGTPSDSLIAFALGDRPVATSPPVISKTETPARTPAPRVLPEGPGKVLVQRTCGVRCHTLDAVTGIRRDRASWSAMVDNMLARGANAKENEVKVIVDYLAAHFGK
jgi:hypothetical protein